MGEGAASPWRQREALPAGLPGAAADGRRRRPGPEGGSADHPQGATEGTDRPGGECNHEGGCRGRGAEVTVVGLGGWLDFGTGHSLCCTHPHPTPTLHSPSMPWFAFSHGDAIALHFPGALSAVVDGGEDAGPVPAPLATWDRRGPGRSGDTKCRRNRCRQNHIVEKKWK